MSLIFFFTYSHFSSIYSKRVRRKYICVQIRMWVSSLVQTQYSTWEYPSIPQCPTFMTKKVIMDHDESKITNKDSDNNKRTSMYGCIVVLSSKYSAKRKMNCYKFILRGYHLGIMIWHLIGDILEFKPFWQLISFWKFKKHLLQK